MIKRCFSLILFVAVLAVTDLAQQPAPPKTHLKVGQPAPEFVLTDTEGKELKLSDFKGNKAARWLPRLAPTRRVFI